MKRTKRFGIGVLLLLFSAGICRGEGLQIETSNAALQRLFDTAMERAAANLRDYADGRRVLVEGDIWNGLWLETQPMGGVMYGKCDPVVAINNMNVIMEGQRDDGLLPAMTELNGNRWYGSLGMNMVAAYGLEVYYLLDEDRDFLQRLYATLERYDRFLWRYRDTDGDGCLEQFGVVDTGEDGTTRYDLPRDAAVTARPTRTVESSLIMADSYRNRATLASVSALLGNGREAYWRAVADSVAARVSDYLWNPSLGVVFDRDSANREIVCDNSQTLLRTMFMGAVSQPMADRMVERLMDSTLFFTRVPFPSIAPGDKKYLRSEDNEYCAWSGPSQGLTLQRSVRALENYGHCAELGLVAGRFFDVLERHAGDFNVQFNPETGASMGSGGYGPMILAALEYLTHLYGLYPCGDEVVWNGLALDGEEYLACRQRYRGREYRLLQADGVLRGYVDGGQAFEVSSGVRIVTDRSGRMKRIIGLSPVEVSVKVVQGGVPVSITVAPNEVYSLENGRWRKTSAVQFFNPYSQK